MLLVEKVGRAAKIGKGSTIYKKCGIRVGRSRLENQQQCKQNEMCKEVKTDERYGVFETWITR